MPIDVITPNCPDLITAESPEAAARRAHYEQILTRLEQPLIELEQAFAALETAKRNEAELERDFRNAESEEAALLKDPGPEKEVVLVNLRVTKDVRASRLVDGMTMNILVRHLPCPKT